MNDDIDKLPVKKLILDKQYLYYEKVHKDVYKRSLRETTLSYYMQIHKYVRDPRERNGKVTMFFCFFFSQV